MAIAQEITGVGSRHDRGCCDEINVICSESRSGDCGKCTAIPPILYKDYDWTFPCRARTVGEVDQHCAKNGRDVRRTRESICRPERGSTNTQNALAPSAPDYRASTL